MAIEQAAALAPLMKKAMAARKNLKQYKNIEGQIYLKSALYFLKLSFSTKNFLRQ